MFSQISQTQEGSDEELWNYDEAAKEEKIMSQTEGQTQYLEQQIQSEKDSHEITKKKIEGKQFEIDTLTERVAYLESKCSQLEGQLEQSKENSTKLITQQSTIDGLERKIISLEKEVLKHKTQAQELQRKIDDYHLDENHTKARQDLERRRSQLLTSERPSLRFGSTPASILSPVAMIIEEDEEDEENELKTTTTSSSAVTKPPKKKSLFSWGSESSAPAIIEESSAPSTVAVTATTADPNTTPNINTDINTNTNTNTTTTSSAVSEPVSSSATVSIIPTPTAVAIATLPEQYSQQTQVQPPTHKKNSVSASKIKQFEAQIDLLKQENLTLCDENEELRLTITQHDLEVHNFQSEINDLQQKIQDQERILELTENSKKMLEKRCKSHEEIIRILEQSKSSAESQASHQSSLVAQLNQTETKLEKIIMSLEDEKSELEEKLVQLERKIGELELDLITANETRDSQTKANEPAPGVKIRVPVQEGSILRADKALEGVSNLISFGGGLFSFGGDKDKDKEKEGGESQNSNVSKLMGSLNPLSLMGGSGKEEEGGESKSRSSSPINLKFW